MLTRNDRNPNASPAPTLTLFARPDPAIWLEGSQEYPEVQSARSELMKESPVSTNGVKS